MDPDDDDMVNVDLKQWTTMTLSFQIINIAQSLIYGMYLAAYFIYYHKTITRFNRVILIVFGLGLCLRTVLFGVIYLKFTQPKQD